jgi:hypothetical protein
MGTQNQSDDIDYSQQIEDFGETLLRQQEALKESGATISSLKGELEGTRTTIDKLRKVFVNEEEPKQDKKAEFKKLLDDVNNAELEDKRRGGKGLPLTTKIGKEFSEFAQTTLEKNEKLEKEVAEMKKQLELQSNSAFQNMQRVSHVAENMVEEALDKLYGDDPDAKQVKEFQGESIKAMIHKEIKDMVSKKEYDNIKKLNNPKNVRAMVSHFASKILPPKVRQILDEEHIKNQPEDPKQLMLALREANKKVAEAETDAEYRHWENIVADIRQRYLAETMGKKGGSINSILSGK